MKAKYQVIEQTEAALRLVESLTANTGIEVLEYWAKEAKLRMEALNEYLNSTCHHCGNGAIEHIKEYQYRCLGFKCKIAEYSFQTECKNDATVVAYASNGESFLICLECLGYHSAVLERRCCSTFRGREEQKKIKYEEPSLSQQAQYYTEGMGSLDWEPVE